MSLHALLVGVNEYHPSSFVPSLNGCVNDVDVMRQFLEARFADETHTIVTLTNEEATRQAVVEAFKSTLAGTDIKAGDIVLFYYSGHGSYGPSAPEFVAKGLDTKNTDETLVLYDSRLPGNYDLADKEIALLLASIDQAATIVVILDSCHSGSATRSLADTIRQGKAKFTAPTAETTRNLDQYASHGDLSYAKMDPLQIPASKHILLAACGRDELAYEAAEPRGLFSLTLLDILSQSATNISYTELFQYIYAKIKTAATRQTPQLKPYDGFNPTQSFLSNEVQKANPTYILRNMDGDWVIDYGALHGMPVDQDIVANIKVAIYDGQTREPVTIAPINRVRLNDTTINSLPELNPEKMYKAQLINVPPALYVYVKGDQQQIDAFLAAPNNDANNIRIHQDQEAFANMTLEITNEQLIITDNKTGQLVHGTKRGDKDIAYIYEALRQIAKWRSFAALHHTQTGLDEASIDFTLQIKQPDGQWIDCEGSDITLDITRERSEIPFRFKLRSTSDSPYYIALYRLSSTFAIEKYTQDVDAAQLTKTHTPSILVNVGDKEDPFTMTLEEPDNEETEIYKLIISKDIFFDYFLPESRELKRELVTSRTAGTRAIKKPNKGNWMIKTITVRIVRQQQQVDDQKGFSNNILTIDKHPTFKSNIALTALEQPTRSLNPLSILKDVFKDEKFAFINLSAKPAGRTVNALSEAVVELSGIEGDANLEQDPLKMQLNLDLKPEEQAFAVTIVDGLVMPLGFVEKAETGNTHSFALHAAPVTADIRREATRSPARALWFCFLKVIGKEDKVFKLRQIKYEKGEVKYIDLPPTTELQASKGILVLIHGIIGNTKSIAANLECLITDTQYPYQHILAFDYENLNTSLDKIANELRDHLEDASVTETRKIDILAHSMGGLISRQLIEKKKGYKMVDRLFLAGTPSNGSAFGELPTFRNWAVGVLTLACNYGKQFLGGFAPFLEATNAVLGATKVITNTLEEMKPGSDFIKELNRKPEDPISTKYHILAGNTSQYILPEESFLKLQMEKITLAVGKLAYSKVPNDVAVSVESIKHVPQDLIEQSHEIGCHHMNYFEYEKSLDLLKQMLSK